MTTAQATRTPTTGIETKPALGRADDRCGQVSESVMTEAVRYGWLQNVGLDEVITEHREVMAALPYVLIRAIDSDTNVSEMPWARQRIQASPSWAHLERPLVIRGQRLVELDVEKLFTGFAEIWIPSGLPREGPPDDISLAAPTQLEELVPEPLRAWFPGSGWRLGLGDGFGLNFASSDRGLSRSLGLVDD